MIKTKQGDKMKYLLIASLVFVGCTKDKQQADVTAKDGKDGVSITGPAGTNGADGASCTTQAVSNGVKIKCGSTESTLTNGSNGVNGTNGAIGPKGDAGANGQSVTGPVGQAGSNGKNAVIKQYTATTAQCPSGGIVIDTFTDMNSNNTYDAGIDTNYQRTVLCNTVVVETEDEHHEKYHHGHNHDKYHDKNCERGE